jgi:hypothetical protein
VISPRLWPTTVATIGRTFGVRGTALRLGHELRRQVNAFRSAPRYAVTVLPPEPHPFAVDRSPLVAAIEHAPAIARGERVVAGEYQAYRAEWRPFPATAEEWTRNPRTGHRYAAEKGWWHTPHVTIGAGDIKDVWEPARFGWVFDLVRAYLLTGDDRFASAFHQRLADWIASSPPFRGVHWSCGQETAIRAIALLYAEANLASARSTTAPALARLASVLAASGERIADAIGYAISQRNNHGISEAAGLVVLGVRFSGAHPEAAAWLRRGRLLLERLILEQFAEDGWYVQHSFAYLRLALDQCVVAERALRSVGDKLSAQAVRRLCAAGELLVAVVDDDSGIVPNYGANDGAFVHPITLAPYRDFRPVLTAISGMFGAPVPSDVPLDIEVLAWLGLAVPRAAPPRADGITTGASGWAAARIGGTAVFLRAGRYRSRPSHLDALHVDVRLEGREFVVDPGTFAYQAAPPWRNALVTARVHNGPILDDVEPGIRGPRFLWFAWPAADLVHAHAEDAGSARLIAELPGRVRRTVRVTAKGAVVDDEVLHGSAHWLRVCWLLHPAADVKMIACSEPVRHVVAGEDGQIGWFSPHYGERLPSVAVVVERSAEIGAHIQSRIGAALNPDELPQADGIVSRSHSAFRV